MGKIATEQEAYNIGGTKDGLFVANKCCTKERAEIMGCDVNEDYDSNLKSATIIKYTIKGRFMSR